MKFFYLLTFTLLSIVHAGSKYYDGENRPYEFGFNIDGNQHRHEQKDANGIIMGEFGFITADGVYHVTVYATDAEGNFKVLSMKNLRKMPFNAIQPTTRSPITSPAKYEINLLKSTKTKPYDIVTGKPSDIASCAGCAIPETIKSMTNLQEIGLPQKLSKPDSAAINNKPINQLNNLLNSNEPLKQTSYEIKSQQNMFEKSDGLKNVPNQYSPMPPPAKDSEQPILQLEQLSYQKVPKMSLINTETNLLQLNENINQSPLPNLQNQKINKNNVDKMLTGLLYKFNYDVGYHGHREQGDRNGNKEGSYYVVGRDGYKRTVNYKANEFGYQPHVKLELASPEETPREESEKEKGLKDYEFKWFYLK